MSQEWLLRQRRLAIEKIKPDIVHRILNCTPTSRHTNILRLWLTGLRGTATYELIGGKAYFSPLDAGAPWREDARRFLELGALLHLIHGPIKIDQVKKQFNSACEFLGIPHSRWYLNRAASEAKRHGYISKSKTFSVLRLGRAVLPPELCRHLPVVPTTSRDATKALPRGWAQKLARDISRGNIISNRGFKARYGLTLAQARDKVRRWKNTGNRATMRKIFSGIVKA